MEDILVSVIVPVYNVENYLRQCLDSITGQTLKNIEIICVDDSSTDGSKQILEEYAEKDERIKVITQPNKGAGAASRICWNSPTIRRKQITQILLYSNRTSIIQMKTDMLKCRGLYGKRRFHRIHRSTIGR